MTLLGNRFRTIAVLAALAFPTLLICCFCEAQQMPIPAQSNLPTSATPRPAEGRTRTAREDEEIAADVLMARKQYAEASAAYGRLLEKEPGNSALLNKLGIAYHQQVRLDLAKRSYERAVKADPSNANAWNNIGTVHYQRKSYRRAIKAYKKALAGKPDMPAVHSNLGYAYFAQKRYDQAMAAFRRALELDPSVFERSHSTGTLLQDRTVDDRGTFYFFLAKSYATMGDAPRCAQYLRKARDEGYKKLAAVRTDPAFASVVDDPAVRQILEPSATSENPPPSGPPGS